MTKLTFGKHKGKDLTEVDLGYLRWLMKCEAIMKSKPEMTEEIRAEIVRRGADPDMKKRVRKKKVDNRPIRFKSKDDVWWRT